MEFSSNRMHLIERYYNDRLTDEELAFFNQQLIKDSKFAEEVRQLKFIFKGIDKARSQKIKHELLEIERDIQGSKLVSDSKRAFFQKHSDTAVLSLVLVAFVFLASLIDFDINNELLYAEYFRPYPNVIAPTTRSVEQQNTAIYKAMSQYDSAQYSNAVSQFEVLLEETELKNEILFYKSIALMSDGLHEEAKIQFMQMDESGSFNSQRKWYLALTLVQLNELKDAKVLLNEIEHSFTSYSFDAKELSEKLFSEGD